jgi:hypothetical protein
MEDHRSSKFPELTMSLFQQLKEVFKTETGQPFIFSGSGTGAWEAALTNTLSPGDKVLAPRFGQFSHLWIDLAQRVGLDVVVQDEEWGTGASPERIEEALRRITRTRSVSQQVAADIVSAKHFLPRRWCSRAPEPQAHARTVQGAPVGGWSACDRHSACGSVDGLVSGIKSHIIEIASKLTDAILRNVAAQSKFAATSPKSAVLSAAPSPDAVPMMP